MFYDENDIDFMFSFNGKQNYFIKEYNLNSLIELRDNNIEAISQLLKKIIMMRDQISDDKIKINLGYAINFVNICLEANLNFDCVKWVKAGPQHFSQMRALEFKFDSLIDSFMKCLGQFKISVSRGNKEDSIFLRKLLYAHNECFSTIGIYGLSSEDAQNLICGKYGVDPHNFDVDISEDQNEKFRIFRIPFWVTYPMYQEKNSQLVNYTQTPICFGDIVYNKTYYDEVFNRSHESKRNEIKKIILR